MTAPTPTRLEEIRRHHDGGTHCNPDRDEACALLAMVDSLRSSNAALRRALEKYGSHRGTCDVVWNEEPTDECTCGLAEALEGET
jgi:hypothetical protein